MEVLSGIRRKGVLEDAKLYASLTDDIEEQKRFEKLGLDRIRRYYTLPADRRERETGLPLSPDELLAERAENLILLALQEMERD